MASYAYVVHRTARQVISRRRKNENVFKMSKDEKCTCKANKNPVFHCQICKFVGFLVPSSTSSGLLKLPVLCRGRTGDEVSIRGKPLSDPSQAFFDVGASWSSLSSFPDRLSASESSLVLRPFSSASNFSVCSISDRRFFSFATQFLQTYLFSTVYRKDISELSISVATSNCFHRIESNTLSFRFSMTRQHKLQYTDESDIAFLTFSNANNCLACTKFFNFSTYGLYKIFQADLYKKKSIHATIFIFRYFARI